MWFWLSLIALLCWRGSDLFSKIGCRDARDARALAAYLADRDPGVALTDGAVIRLDENEHTKEEEHGRAGHL